MNTFISWRVSRLVKGEAWKRACSLEGIISLVCLLTLIFCLHWGTIPDKTVYWFMVGGVIGFAWLVSDKVLGADDCFQVKTMNGPCKVWVYVLRGERMQYKIVLKTKDWEKICIANAYDRDIFAGTKDAFIFNPNFEGYSDAWRFVGEDFSSVETIGIRVSKYVFADLVQDEGKITLNLLNENGIKTVSVDSYVADNIYVTSDVFLNPADDGDERGFFVCNVRDFLIMKNDGHYSVLGFEQKSKQNPKCIALKVPSMVFHEGNETVILAYDDDEEDYREIYRGIAMGRKSSTLITELLKKNGFSGMYGRVRRFDPETKKLKTLYVGALSAIHFVDGEVLTADGQLFKP